MKIVFEQQGIEIDLKIITKQKMRNISFKNKKFTYTRRESQWF